jgi:hypothetical protein
VWLELDEIEVEGRELPADVVRMIRTTAQYLERLDPYMLLGVEPDAEWREVEAAFRQRLATFHPNHWQGYELGELRPSMERVASRIWFAFAFLAEEAAREGSLPAMPDERHLDRVIRAQLGAADCDPSGERPTFPSSIVCSVAKGADPPRARPPRPPPRKAG